MIGRNYRNDTRKLGVKTTHREGDYRKRDRWCK